MFVVPSIFTAIDRLTGPNAKMAASVQNFADKAQAASARMERSYRRMPSIVNDTTKEILGLANSAVILGGAFLTVKSVMDYETEMANLKALTGKTGKEFEVFQGKIKDVAGQTSTSAVEVTKAFTAIANNQPALADNAEALAAVTKSSIILAQAARMDLQPAGEALTQILNQFGLGANYAAKAVDILAAGSVKGSSEITDTAAAIQKFGTVAANSMIKLYESVALIELASKFEKGAEAGSKLRNILLAMSTAKVLDPKAKADMRRLGVDMNVVTNKSLSLNERLKEMAKVAKDDAAMFHIFGKENQALATGVLSTAGNFKEMLKSVNEDGRAKAMAEENNKTFAKSLEQLRDKFINFILHSDQAKQALEMGAAAARWVAHNLSTIVKIGVAVIGFFAAWKAAIWLNNAALFVYNVALGITAVASNSVSLALKANTVAFGAYRAALWVSTAAQYAFNLAVSLNPVAGVVIAVLALVAALGYVIANYKTIQEFHQEALTKNKAQGVRDETKAVLQLAQSYQKYGYSREEAQKRAVAAEREDAKRDLTYLKKKLESATTDAEKRVVDQGMATVEGKLSVLNSSDELFKAVNSKADEKVAVQKYLETKNANVNINIKDPNNRVEADSKDSFVNIITSSTM